MRAIAKNAEPASLTYHRAQDHCAYDNYTAKQDLRDALVAEQRGLCCYCMGRIEPTTSGMKIEHWRCTARFTEDQLRYSNILGCCKGGEGFPRKQQYCDTRKADADLLWNPADPSYRIEDRLLYEFDGTIRSTDDTFNAQLNDVLNLNLPFLKQNRRGVLSGVLDWWKKRKPVAPAAIQREIDKRQGGNGLLQPYEQVAVWHLRKKLMRIRE